LYAAQIRTWRNLDADVVNEVTAGTGPRAVGTT